MGPDQVPASPSDQTPSTEFVSQVESGAAAGGPAHDGRGDVDEMNRIETRIDPPVAGRTRTARIYIASLAGLSTAASMGSVAWLVPGGLTGLLSATAPWKCIDPLCLLEPAEGAHGRRRRRLRKSKVEQPG